jgi:hypothetical protein
MSSPQALKLSWAHQAKVFAENGYVAGETAKLLGGIATQALDTLGLTLDRRMFHVKHSP